MPVSVEYVLIKNIFLIIYVCTNLASFEDVILTASVIRTRHVVKEGIYKLGLSCAKLSLASAKLHTSLSSDQLKLATN